MDTLRNRVQLIGNLGRDPEIRNLTNGKMVGNFSLATSEVYYNGDGKRINETQWHNIVVWGKKAEIAEQYLKKGKQVAIEGKLIHRDYEDKNGQKRYISEVVVNDLVMLGGNGKAK